MARPTPDYMPDAIVDYCTGRGITIKDLSSELGYGQSWLYKLFQGDQGNLIPYAKLADFANISLESLVEKIENDDTATMINKLKAKHGCSSMIQLSKLVGVSDSFLRSLCSRGGELNGLTSYVILARKIDEPIDKLLKPSSRRT